MMCELLLGFALAYGLAVLVVGQFADVGRLPVFLNGGGCASRRCGRDSAYGWALGESAHRQSGTDEAIQIVVCPCGDAQTDMLCP